MRQSPATNADMTTPRATYCLLLLLAHRFCSKYLIGSPCSTKCPPWGSNPRPTT